MPLDNLKEEKDDGVLMLWEAEFHPIFDNMMSKSWLSLVEDQMWDEVKEQNNQEKETEAPKYIIIINNSEDETEEKKEIIVIDDSDEDKDD